MSEQQQAQGFICRECGNYINEQGSYVDHHADCPVQTNWWVVENTLDVCCYLCDRWLQRHESYRMIPVIIYLGDELLDALELIPGTTTQESRPVCRECSRPRLIPDPSGVGNAAAATPAR